MVIYCSLRIGKRLWLAVLSFSVRYGTYFVLFLTSLQSSLLVNPTSVPSPPAPLIDTVKVIISVAWQWSISGEDFGNQWYPPLVGARDTLAGLPCEGRRAIRFFLTYGGRSQEPAFQWYWALPIERKATTIPPPTASEQEGKGAAATAASDKILSYTGGIQVNMTENLRKQPRRGILKQSTSFEQRDLEPPSQ